MTESAPAIAPAIAVSGAPADGNGEPRWIPAGAGQSTAQVRKPANTSRRSGPKKFR